MPKRKLVEITLEQHRHFEILRAKIKKSGKRVPSIPLLVQTAVDYGLPSTVGEYAPESSAINER